MAKQKQDNYKFAVNPCSMCEKVDLTFGQQSWGGVRWCQECLKKSFSWFQLNEEQRTKITLLYDKLRQHDKIKQQLQDAEKITPEDLKNLSIGEAKFRVMDSLKYG
jgi:hypothetical protein